MFLRESCEKKNIYIHARTFGFVANDVTSERRNNEVADILIALAAPDNGIFGLAI